MGIDDDYEGLDDEFLLKARPVREVVGLPKELWSEVAPGLWQGGTSDWDTCFEVRRSPKPAITAKHFDTVITAYAWANPCDWEVKELRYGYYDSDRPDWHKEVDFETIFHLVDIAYADWKKGKKILSRCQAGLNRSSIFTALILMKDGYAAQDAINLIREKRSPWALFNKNFEKWLLEQDAAPEERGS